MEIPYNTIFVVAIGRSCDVVTYKICLGLLSEWSGVGPVDTLENNS